MSEKLSLYSGQETVRIKGFKHDVIKERIASATVHTPDSNKFKQFVFDLITKRGNINEQTAQQLLDERGMERIQIAFTHSTMIGETNYEFFEMLGDRSVNKAIIWYMHRRFPDISNNDNAPMYMTELKKRYENKRNFSIWAEKLGFTEYIRYTELVYLRGKNFLELARMNESMLEDCFEAFCGVLEDLIDGRIGLGVGYGIVYNIITSLLDEEYITTDLSKLVDVKTQLKELIESQEIKKFGPSLKSETPNLNPEGGVAFQTKIKLSFDKSPCPKYTGKLNLEFVSSKVYHKKLDAEIDASKQVLNWFNKECGITWSSVKY